MIIHIRVLLHPILPVLEVPISSSRFVSTILQQSARLGWQI